MFAYRTLITSERRWRSTSINCTCRTKLVSTASPRTLAPLAVRWCPYKENIMVNVGEVTIQLKYVEWSHHIWDILVEICWKIRGMRYVGGVTIQLRYITEFRIELGNKMLLLFYDFFITLHAKHLAPNTGPERVFRPLWFLFPGHWRVQVPNDRPESKINDMKTVQLPDIGKSFLKLISERS